MFMIENVGHFCCLQFLTLLYEKLREVLNVHSYFTDETNTVGGSNAVFK